MSESKHKPRGWRLWVQRIASTPGMTAIFSHIVHYVDRPFLRISGGRFSLSGFLAGWPTVVLTTVGAKSGLPRTTPLVGIEDGENVILIASNFGRPHHPDWYYNLKAHPLATLTLRGRARPYLAREATEGERQRCWELAAQVYIGFPLYQQRAGQRRIPILVLVPQEP
ncbi:MAG: nitroreductase/quinone reductase family protein [Chloroflexota bacterium]